MGWSRDPSTGLVLPESTMPSTPQGSKESAAQMLKDDFKQLLTDILHDKVGHAMAVAGGEFHWREVFTKEYGACFNGNRSQCDTLADVLFRFIRTSWRTKYPQESASQFLDGVHIPKELSEAEKEAEIDDAWEVEIASCQESMERSYVGSARTRKGKDAFNTFWQRPQKA